MADRIHLDTDALRVLAHPLRSRLLSRLRVHGPATATQLADQLDTNTGATSYHLRKLESVGLVTDTGTGQGKRRIWRAASSAHEWTPSEFAGDQDAEESLSWLTRHYQAMLAERAEWWSQVEREWPAAWRDALGSSDHGVVVTPEQARALRADLQAVLERYREAGTDQPGAIQLQVWNLLLPMVEQPPPERT